MTAQKLTASFALACSALTGCANVGLGVSFIPTRHGVVPVPTVTVQPQPVYVQPQPVYVVPAVPAYGAPVYTRRPVCRADYWGNVYCR